jgi:hypothetical protein
MLVSLAAGYGMAAALDVSALVIMLLAGFTGLMSSMFVAETAPRRLVRAMLYLPVPLCAPLLLGTWLAPYRPAELVLAGVVTAGALLVIGRGPLGAVTWMLGFIGLLLSSMQAVPRALWWQIILSMFAVSVALLVARLLLCYPTPREDLRRAQRAFVVETRRILTAAAGELDPGHRSGSAARRMNRAQRRLHHTALNIEGRLAMPQLSADPYEAELFHRHLFDAELALAGIGGAVRDLTSHQLPPALRGVLVTALADARDADPARSPALHSAAEAVRRAAADHGAEVQYAAAHGAEMRYAATSALVAQVADQLDALADALAGWLDGGRRSGADTAQGVSFLPTVVLEAGSVATSGPAARKLLAAQGGTGWRRFIPKYRGTLQLAIGAAIVVPSSDAISGHRYYWGLIGLALVSMTPNSTAERVSKLAHRVAGTALGAVGGIALAQLLTHVTGDAHVYWTLAVIVAGLSLGSWGAPRLYGYWTFGLTLALTQVYALTTPMNQMDWLLTQRVMLNGLGMAVGTLVALVLFPIGTSKLTGEALRSYLDVTRTLIEQVGQRWNDPAAPVRLRATSRALDVALNSMESFFSTLVVTQVQLPGRSADGRLVLLRDAARHARALAAIADVDVRLSADTRATLGRTLEGFGRSFSALSVDPGSGRLNGDWIRVSPLVRSLQAAPELVGNPRVQGALEQLAAIDEALAGMAGTRVLVVTVPAEDSTVSTVSTDSTAVGAQDYRLPTVPVRPALQAVCGEARMTSNGAGRARNPHATGNGRNGAGCTGSAGRGRSRLTPAAPARPAAVRCADSE